VPAERVVLVPGVPAVTWARVAIGFVIVGCILAAATIITAVVMLISDVAALGKVAAVLMGIFWALFLVVRVFSALSLRRSTAEIKAGYTTLRRGAPGLREADPVTGIVIRHWSDDVLSRPEHRARLRTARNTSPATPFTVVRRARAER
jgi:hypothetical protein